MKNAWRAAVFLARRAGHAIRGPAALLVVLAAGPVLGGFRHPATWTLAAAALWLGARRAPLGRPPGILLWLVWLGWTFLSALACDEPLRALGAFAEPATAVLVLAWASGLGALESRSLLKGLLAWSIPLAAASFLNLHPGYPMTGLLPPYYNYTACFLAAAAAAGVSLLASRSKGTGAARERWLAGAAILAAAAGLAVSGSRGGAAAALFGTAAALWRADRRRLLGGLAVCALGTIALTPSARLHDWLKLDRAGPNQRPAIWAAAAAAANDAPLLGAGPGRFEAGFLRHNFQSSIGIARYGLSTAHAHSEPLQAAAETGWLGLALLLGALWSSLRRALSGGSERYRDGALAALAAITVQASVDNVFALPWLRLIYAALLGVAAGNRTEARPAPMAWRPALAGLLVAGTWGRWPGWLGEELRSRAERADSVEARSLLRTARRILPAQPDLLEAEARAALRAETPDLAAAQASLERAYALSPYRAALPQMLAEIAVAKRDWEEGLRRAREAWQLEPEFLEARLVEAEVLARLGRKDDSLEALRKLDLARARLANGPAPLSPYDRLISYFDKRRWREVLERLGVEDAGVGQKT